MRKTTILSAVTALVAVGSYFAYAQDPMGGGMMGGQQSEWKAPPGVAGRSNPVPADPESVAAGETLFNRYCASCHGMNAKGNNGAAADLTSQAVQSQSDGALFWKISQGRSPMPSFANTLTAHQGWDIINYIRTLASSPAQNATGTMQPGMGGGMRARGMMGGGMQGRGMMGGGVMGSDGMMGPMMRSTSIVAIPDGGIIALVGNQLSKYDEDLNLVKQVEIDFNWKNWQKTMMQHRNMMMQSAGMLGWGGMMGPMMRSATVVATPDGGAIVLMGSELFKYDKDLNLAKKAEISFDWDNWQKVMMQHRYMMMGLSQQPGSQGPQ